MVWLLVKLLLLIRKLLGLALFALVTLSVLFPTKNSSQITRSLVAAIAGKAIQTLPFALACVFHPVG